MEQKKATQVNECRQCKKWLSTTQKGLLTISFYILISSIYGTIKLILLLSDLF